MFPRRNSVWPDGCSRNPRTEIDALYDWEENHAIPEAGSHLGISNVYTCKNLCELVKVSDAEVLMRYGEDFYQGYPGTDSIKHSAKAMYTMYALIWNLDSIRISMASSKQKPD